MITLMMTATHNAGLVALFASMAFWIVIGTPVLHMIRYKYQIGRPHPVYIKARRAYRVFVKDIVRPFKRVI